MPRTWVVNLSPLILLSKANQTDLLLKLCTKLVIPRAVLDEINRGPSADPACIWIREHQSSIVETVEVDERVSVWDLGAGESEVLSYALRFPTTTAILDDKAARRAGEILGVPVVGTLGLVAAAKLAGHLPEVKPVVEKLLQCGF